MRNLTLRVEEGTLQRAREIALSRDTSVNALVREFLEELAKGQERREEARKELLRLFQETPGGSLTGEWKRDDLYDR